ncbi:MAG: geranylgeranyl pyrophosphate synthase [Propionibacterium sp.]|nr:MAG: geranylgeranyl pyrophosphate synthase [Propionibacterium sp.]
MHNTSVSDFAATLQQQLAVIEERLMATVATDWPFLTEVAQHITGAGGKRFRPLLVCTAANFGEPVADEDRITAALAVELTHVASLYHDDVMDEAPLRRGAPSANDRWGNFIAIMAGDFLFARASAMVAKLGADYVKLQAETFGRLVKGQIAETVGPEDNEDRLEHYLQVIADKTGSLIATSAVFGGMISNASDEVITALSKFGEEIGIVFQLSDDLIDITSEHTGKTPGTDLREGVATLPTLLLQASTDPADDELKALITGDLSNDDDLALALEKLRAHSVMEKAYNEVQRRAELARNYLTPLPDCAAKDALIQVCSDIVGRIN